MSKTCIKWEYQRFLMYNKTLTKCKPNFFWFYSWPFNILFYIDRIKMYSKRNKICYGKFQTLMDWEQIHTKLTIIIHKVESFRDFEVNSLVPRYITQQYLSSKVFFTNAVLENWSQIAITFLSKKKKILDFFLSNFRRPKNFG